MRARGSSGQRRRWIELAEMTVAKRWRPGTTKGHTQKCENFPKGNLECAHVRERPLYLYLLRAWDSMSNKGTADCVV